MGFLAINAHITLVPETGVMIISAFNMSSAKFAFCVTLIDEFIGLEYLPHF